MLASGPPAHQRRNLGPNGRSRFALLRLRERSRAHLLQSTRRSRCRCLDSSPTDSRRHAHVQRFSQVADSQLPARSEAFRRLFIGATGPSHSIARRMRHMQMFDEWSLALSTSTSEHCQRHARRTSATTCQVDRRVFLSNRNVPTLSFDAYHR